jgi:hypothetical protein
MKEAAEHEQKLIKNKKSRGMEGSTTHSYVFLTDSFVSHSEGDALALLRLPARFIRLPPRAMPSRAI